MNEFTLIILGTLVLSTLLDVLADILNLRALSPDLPGEFEDVFDAESYRRSQEYTRARTRFGFLATAFDLALLLLFWFAGGFNWLDGIVRSWSLHPLASGIAFIAILGAAKALLDLPFSVYSTFVIEERFGFNRTTVRTFILDLLKSALLALLLGVPLLGLILWLFDAAGVMAWLYCWGAVTVFLLFVQYIAPTWIMPLFNKFTPLEDGALKESIMRFAESVRFPLGGIFVMDGSKRSSKSNAFFSGFGRNKRIAIFDTLIDRHTVPELTAVLAHEIGHYKKQHIIKTTLLSIAQSGVMFFLLSLFVSSGPLAEAFFMDHVSVYAGLVFFGLLYAPISLLVSLAMNAVSRAHEFEADRFALEHYRQPGSLNDALKKLAVDNLSNLTPHPFYVFLHYSHPPLRERLKAIGAGA